MYAAYHPDRKRWFNGYDRAYTPKRPMYSKIRMMIFKKKTDAREAAPDECRIVRLYVDDRVGD